MCSEYDGVFTRIFNKQNFIMMPFRRPRGFNLTDLFVVTVLGSVTGVYIWKPYFKKPSKENEKP